MTSETTKLKAKLFTLSNSLDDLELQIAPLFEKTLSETIVGLDLIQKAKLQTVLPYLVYDLIFIYLKSRGIDPRSHPVVGELDRVRQYFEKIAKAESPEIKRNVVDKAAAGRFIKHAITQAKYGTAPSDSAEPSTSAPHVPVKLTSKMILRAQYEKKMLERDKEGSEELDLEVFEDNDGAVNGNESVDAVAVPPDTEKEGKGTKGKQKQKEVLQEETQINSKRRRPAIDPFAGYGDDIPTDDKQSTKKNKILPTTPGSNSPSDFEAVIPNEAELHATTSNEDVKKQKRGRNSNKSLRNRKK